MLYLHQVHRVASANRADFERVARDELMPAIAIDGDSRLIWYASSIDPSCNGSEVITIVALANTDALGRFAARCRDGNLAPIGRRLRELRGGVETRILKALKFNPLDVDLAAVPTTPQNHVTNAYMHDFAPPRVGKRRAYEDAMVKIYMSMSNTELLDIVLWAGLEPVAGPIPAEVNISAIRNVDALVKLLVNDIPRENKQLGTWMHEALSLRDRWTTRLVRCSSWSPLY